MKLNLDRRQLLVGAAGGALTLTPFMSGRAQASTELTAVEWGGTYIDAMQALAKEQDAYDLNWVLHEGSSTGILAKIKAALPAAPYDLVAGWDPIFQAAIREGWVETFTVDDIPNLKNVPESLIYKDDAGKWAAVPRAISAAHFFYREDTCPFPITKIEDLLDPRLAGQICFPEPVYNTNTAMIVLALRSGGNEHDLESAWAFVKKMAEVGNIGRVTRSDPDTINSISSGETSVSFAGIGTMVELQKNQKIKPLTKMPGDSGFKASLYQEGWFILKGGKTKEAMDYINFNMSPENNEKFNAATGGIPTNSAAKLSDSMSVWSYNDEELKAHTYTADWSFVSEQVDGWVKRWEQEIAPLL
jgi:putative spermidine/putrescine transport system substrate-binding protein